MSAFDSDICLVMSDYIYRRSLTCVSHTGVGCWILHWIFVFRMMWTELSAGQFKEGWCYISIITGHMDTASRVCVFILVGFITMSEFSWTTKCWHAGALHHVSRKYCSSVGVTGDPNTGHAAAWALDVQLHPLLTLELDGSDWSISRSGRFTRFPFSIEWEVGWVTDPAWTFCTKVTSVDPGESCSPQTRFFEWIRSSLLILQGNSN